MVTVILPLPCCPLPLLQQLWQILWVFSLAISRPSLHRPFLRITTAYRIVFYCDTCVNRLFANNNNNIHNNNNNNNRCIQCNAQWSKESRSRSFAHPTRPTVPQKKSYIYFENIMTILLILLLNVIIIIVNKSAILRQYEYDLKSIYTTLKTQNLNKFRGDTCLQIFKKSRKFQNVLIAIFRK